MAAANTLLHILYSLAALSTNQKPATDVTEELSQTSTEKPYFEDVATYTPLRIMAVGYCRRGEKWSHCRANCQHDCSNVGLDPICNKYCQPGCVCEEPSEVRGQMGNVSLLHHVLKLQNKKKDVQEEKNGAIVELTVNTTVQT
ncbi:hypothetical protein TNCT_307511 [Trichonephila clavata]|uniref:TIL domain-containing protein n=1 Tax=Trichonephila clavata TaxID=2740835 RepID=A0A8X6H7T4_TRICU|nr:hypothetical protein TNCT_307511 [Trichonephila clavata]